MFSHEVSRQEAIEALARGRHGVVARAQLLGAGMPSRTIERWITAGRLHPVHRGVYRVGPEPSSRGRAMAAVLACGEGAVVSHESAAALWNLLSEGPSTDPVDIALRRGERRRPGVRIRRLFTLHRREVTSLERIPITTPARTLLDLASVVDARRLAQAAGEAQARRMTTRAEVMAVLRRHPRQRGAALLRELFGAGRPGHTRSAAERRFRALVATADLPAPRVNVEVEGFEVDFYWPEAGLVAEIDGFAVHSLADRFERDRLRDATLTAAGVRVMRVTWKQLAGEPYAVIGRLALAIGSAR